MSSLEFAGVLGAQRSPFRVALPRCESWFGQIRAKRNLLGTAGCAVPRATPRTQLAAFLVTWAPTRVRFVSHRRAAGPVSVKSTQREIYLARLDARYLGLPGAHNLQRFRCPGKNTGQTRLNFISQKLVKTCQDAPLYKAFAMHTS